MDFDVAAFERKCVKLLFSAQRKAQHGMLLDDVCEMLMEQITKLLQAEAVYIVEPQDAQQCTIIKSWPRAAPALDITKLDTEVLFNYDVPGIQETDDFVAVGFQPHVLENDTAIINAAVLKRPSVKALDWSVLRWFMSCAKTGLVNQESIGEILSAFCSRVGCAMSTWLSDVCVLSNEPFHDLSGIAAQAKWSDFLALFDSDWQQQIEAARQAVLTGGPGETALHAAALRKEISQVRFVRVYLYAFEPKEGSFAVVLRNERDVNELEELLEDSENALHDFVRNVSLGIRTPMNVIMGMIDLCLDMVKQNAASPDAQSLVEVSEYLLEARNASYELVALYNDVEDCFKLREGAISVNAHSFDLRMCIDEAHEIVEAEAQQKYVDLGYYVDWDVPNVLIADDEKLQHVMVNLLRNLIAKPGNEKITTYVRLADPHSHSSSSDSATSDQHDTEFMLEFLITDSDIDEELLGEIALNAPVETASENGVSTYISKQLCKLLGGTLARGKPGKNRDLFVFCIKAHVEDTDMAANDGKQSSDATQMDQKVLIIDNNIETVQDASIMLLQWGFQPMSATSPQQAAMYLQQEGFAFDLILLNPKMLKKENDKALGDAFGSATTDRFRRKNSATQVRTSLTHANFDQVLNSLELALRKARSPIVALVRKPPKHEEEMFAAYLKKPLARRTDKLRRLCYNLTTGRRVSTAKFSLSSRTDSNEWLANKRAAIVDSNEKNKKVTMYALRTIGLQNMSGFHDGSELMQDMQQAFKSGKQTAYHIVFIHIEAPDFAGMMTAKKITALFEHKPLLVGLGTERIPDTTWKQSGLDVYIRTPCEATTISRLLTRHSAQLSGFESSSEERVL